MSELLITIIGGLVVAFLAWLFGFSGGKSKVVVQGIRVRRTGKWMMLISAAMILGGLAWASSNQLYGYTLAGYGVLFFIVGKVVAWFQKL
ncbi:MAG TPA: hypothetical protein VMU13_03540 [Candidatus Paceibacterota bacterium]|nr:hypothetical protein [Candidatus Paceibacterota bacterium]